MLCHQTFDGATGNFMNLSIKFVPDLACPVDPEIKRPGLLNERQQLGITLGPLASKLRVTLLRDMTPISRRGNLQHFADWLDPVVSPILIDKGVYFSLRSSSALAKKALASFKISLARRSSLTSRFSALTRSR